MPLSYLATIPKAREVILKHLNPNANGIVPNINERLEFMGSIREMFDVNLGGGIPAHICIALMTELDALDLKPWELLSERRRDPCSRRLSRWVINTHLVWVIFG